MRGSMMKRFVSKYGWYVASVIMSIVAIVARGIVSYINTLAYVLVLWSMIAAVIYIAVKIANRREMKG